MPRRAPFPAPAALPLALLALSLVAGGCGAPAASSSSGASPTPAGATSAGAVREADVRAALYTLAADSMEGRGTAQRGSERAARFIAAELARHGIQPAGDSGFFQRVPMRVERRADGRRRLSLVQPGQAVPQAERAHGVNVVGIIRGSDPAMAGEAILVDAHYDHLGIGPAVNGDSIYNGADDDASGVVAVLEMARALGRGPAPKRTVVFLLSTGEEVGLLGTRWYVDHPVVPLERTVANFEVEMIGRPDALAGGAGKGWLTGYDRSTMGQMLARAGIPLVADPRPAQNFFERSDNIVLARRGIPAHVLSSFNLHQDYHSVDDEVERVDFAHMTAVIESAVRAVRMLADGPAPQWLPGGRPAAQGSR